MLAGWMGTQSKGAAVALGISAIAVFAVLPYRLRLLVPTGIVAALVFSQYHALTAPFRDQEDVGVVRHAGTVGLVLAAVGFAVGPAYALADRRLEVPERARRLAAVGVAAAGAAALLIGFVAAEHRIDSHSGFVREQWDVFKQSQAVETGSSHLVNLGTNRYDFWRASLVGVEEHPLAGIGGRGFGPWYLRHGESYETPARAHSLPLDVLLETGVIGFLPLLAAFVVVLVALVRRRHTLLGAAAFGAFAYFAVHVSGDWIWTFPAVGLPVFALVGIALSTEEGVGPTGRWAGAAAAAVVAFALLVFVPPWLSARITTRVLAGDTSAASLSWAKRLDPLSAEPYVAEAALARTPEEAIFPLEDAVAKEPRAVSHRYQLGQAYLAAGRRAEARAQLTVAHALFPRDEDIAKALARASR
jgi:hypothetical protein